MKSLPILIVVFTAIALNTNAQWNQTISSPVKLDPTTTISNSNLVNKFNLPTTDGNAANFSVLSDNWDLGGGYGLIDGANVVSPVVWLYNYGGRNAFTVASKNYSSGQGQGVIGDYLNPLFQIRENGNVGIGTTSPVGRLHVGLFSMSDDNHLVIENYFGFPSPNSRSNISFKSNNGTGSWEVGRITVNPSSLSNTWNETSNGTMRFRLTVNNVLQDVVVIDRDRVGIGTTSPDAKLAVKGQVHAQEVKVDLNGAVAPDYVFEKDYKLTSLEEIKNYIDQNKHLPEVPSAKEMEKNGVQLGEMNMLLLKKIEELTLYVIEQNKKIDNQQKEITELKTFLRK